jgi:hypothetical protein
MCIIPWACAAAEQEIGELPARWMHTLGVVRHAEVVAASGRLGADSETLVAAAYVHDIGYGSAVRRTGFHPLDGARHLRSLGYQRVASLVAYHSSARWEARIIGLASDLAEFEREQSVVADALTYCDMTTGADGQQVTLSQRLDDIAARHGTESVAVRALRLARSDFDRAFAAVEGVLHDIEPAASLAPR